MNKETRGESLDLKSPEESLLEEQKEIFNPNNWIEIPPEGVLAVQIDGSITKAQLNFYEINQHIRDKNGNVRKSRVFSREQGLIMRIEAEPKGNDPNSAVFHIYLAPELKGVRDGLVKEGYKEISAKIPLSNTEGPADGEMAELAFPKKVWVAPEYRINYDELASKWIALRKKAAEQYGIGYNPDSREHLKQLVREKYLKK